MDDIAASEITKTFGATLAVRAVSLAVSPGTSHGFVGMNGAGKTTTIRMLCGRLAPTSGTAAICGLDPTRQPVEVARLMGVVFGENHIPEPEMSPSRYLRHFGRLYGLPKVQERRRTDALFDALGLTPYVSRPLRELSGGNRRKVEIARALLHAPRVLFADEPTRELDIPTKHAVWEFLKELQRDEGLTLFVSSHDAGEIAALCDEVSLIRDGALVWQGGITKLTGGGDSLENVLLRRLRGAPTPFVA